MTALPAVSDLVNTGISKGTFKGALTNLRAYLSGLLGDAGTQSAALSALGAPMGSSTVKSGAYTVVASDRGKVLKCSGTWTLSLNAASTLGDGFSFEIVNDGAGVITIDPNLAETINGSATKSIPAGASTFVFCDGSKFITIGASSASDIAAALGYTPGRNGATFDWVYIGTFVPNGVNFYANYGTGLYRYGTSLCGISADAPNGPPTWTTSYAIYKLTKV